MLIVQNLSMTFGSKLLFYNSSFNLNTNHRYGLVGANGSGKSTFMKIVVGDQEPLDGEIRVKSGDRIGCLRQDQYIMDDEVVVNAVIQGKPELWKSLKTKEEILAKGDLTQEDCEVLGDQEDIILNNDGYSAEDFASKLLSGLGIEESKHFGKMSELSGGFKIRVLLAQALFNNPEVLLLDEPTNHLDLPSIDWLKSYLMDEYQGLLIFISHDQSFIREVSTDILDVDYGEIMLYPGNYERFIQQKVLAEEQILKEKAGLEKRIAELQRFVDRFGAKATKAKQAKSKAKMIDKIELPEVRKSSRIAPRFTFKQEKPSGKEVLSMHKICKAYGEKQVLRGISKTINRGERIGFIGANGIGKSTLLKIITDNLKADSGTFEWGYNTKISYVAQDHFDQLDPNKNLVEWLRSVCPGHDETKIRNALGCMLFSGDESMKKIDALSGGECARLLFAKVMLDKPNVIILDEPTNHLDLEAIEAMQAMLKAFEGTLLFVTHDRCFLENLATDIVELK
jgi:ATPase subunit of ABC transporter with duplicated ATPase domains